MAARGLERVSLPFEGMAAWLADGVRVVGELPDGRLGLARVDADVDPAVEGAIALPGRLSHLLGEQDGALWAIWETTEGCELGAVSIDEGLPADEVDLADEADLAPVADGVPAVEVDNVLRRRAVLPACLDSPTRLPDGRIVGIAYATSPGDAPGDPEVVLFDPAAGELTPLTTGSWIEELPAASADGRRVVFNRRLLPWPADYDLEIYRRVVCWMDVPPR